MSDSVRPHRHQPTRLPRPWDSPGRNTGVGCHFFLQCMKVKVKVKLLSRVRPSVTPWTAAFQAPPSIEFSRQEDWSGVPLPSPTPQFKSINSSLLSFLYSPTLTSTHDHWTDLFDKVMFLPFNMLSRLVITFLPRSKRL